MARRQKFVRTTIVSKQEDENSEVLNFQVCIRKGDLTLAYLLAHRGMIAGIERRMENAMDALVRDFRDDAERIIVQGVDSKAANERTTGDA